METEVTKDRLSEWYPPTKEFTLRDEVLTDYVEVEIEPNGIKKLEENLYRYEYPNSIDKLLFDPYSDHFEHIICYVYFNSGTEDFNDMILVNHTSSFGDDELYIPQLLNDEEKENIIEVGLEYLRQARKNNRWY